MTWAACSRRCFVRCKLLLLLANNWIKCTNTFKWVLKCWAVLLSVRLSVLLSVLTLLHNLRAWISCQIHEPIRAINNWIAICLRIAEHKVRVCKGRNGTMDEWYVSCTYLQYICTYVCEYFLQFSWDKYRERECSSRRPAVQLSNSGSTAIAFWVLDKQTSQCAVYKTVILNSKVIVPYLMRMSLSLTFESGLWRSNCCCCSPPPPAGSIVYCFCTNKNAQQTQRENLIKFSLFPLSRLPATIGISGASFAQFMGNCVPPPSERDAPCNRKWSEPKDSDCI